MWTLFDTGPTIRNRFYLLLRMLDKLGLKQAVYCHAGKVFSLVSKKDTAHIKQTVSEFDRHFAVDTSRAFMPNDLRIRSGGERLGIPYYPSREDFVRKSLHSLPIQFEHYVFVDAGAGKGFVLLLASEFPFRKVIGVEYSQTLTDIANRNICAYAIAARKCKDVQCICANAADFEFPPESTVLYLFNPFQGRIMDQMIANLEKSLQQQPRDLWVIYLTPWEHRKFRRSSEFQTIESNWDFCIYRSIRR